jgi:uncharacterized RDD family membrane protein YckC
MSDPSGPPDQAAAADAAGLWPRFAAMVYEAVLLVGLVFIGDLLFLKLFGDGTRGAMRHAQQVWLAGLCGLYFVFCWTRSGQTLGMKTWGLELRNAHGGRLNVRRATARYVLALAGLLAAGAGFFWALFDRDRQFLHDRLLGTRIVRVPI